MPICYLVTERTIHSDVPDRQGCSEIRLCGIFTTPEKSNTCVLTWHERSHISLGVGDFDSYKLSKPDGLLHLVACIDQRTWEISMQPIDLNSDMNLSLLDPLVPVTQDLASRYHRKRAPKKTTLETDQEMRAKRVGKKTSKLIDLETDRERRLSASLAHKKRKRESVSKYGFDGEGETSFNPLGDSPSDTLLPLSQNDQDATTPRQESPSQTACTPPRQTLFRPCEDDLEIKPEAQEIRDPRIKRRVKVERELKKLGVSITQEKVLQALRDREVL